MGGGADPVYYSTRDFLALKTYSLKLFPEALLSGLLLTAASVWGHSPTTSYSKGSIAHTILVGFMEMGGAMHVLP